MTTLLKNTFSNTNQSLVFISTMVACTLSMVFAISFWSSMGASAKAAIFLGATGCVFEIVKLFALPAFFRAKQERNYFLASYSLSMFMILSLVSMVAGISVLERNLQQNHHERQQNSLIAKGAQFNIDVQETKIENMLEIAKQDNINGYRGRAKQLMESVNAEQEKLRRLKSERLTQESQDTIEHPMLSIPGLSDSAAKNLVIMLGALLEMATAYLLISCQQAKQPKEIQKIPLAQDTIKLEPAKSKESQYEEIVEKIQAKALPVNCGEVRKLMRIGSKTASKYFHRMMQEGIIIKNESNRYVLA